MRISMRVACTVAVMALGFGANISAQGSNANRIYGCVGPGGAIRLSSPATPCKGNETPIEWNIAGPQGPAGPTGASGPAGPTGARGYWAGRRDGCCRGDGRTGAPGRKDLKDHKARRGSRDCRGFRASRDSKGRRDLLVAVVFTSSMDWVPRLAT